MTIDEIIKERAAYGQLEVDELTALAEGILSFPWQPENIIVEIGTYKGRTPIMMAKILRTLGRKQTIVSIDAFERVTPTPLNCRGNYDTVIKNITKARLGEQCNIIISARSDDAAQLIPQTVAALIIDGWHSYEQALRDMENYVPKLVPNGFCLVDDYCAFYPGVIQAVDEFVARGAATVSQKLGKGVILRKTA